MTGRARRAAGAYIWLLLLAGWLAGGVLTAGQARADDEGIDHARSLSRAFRTVAKETTPSVVTVLSKVRVDVAGRRGELRDLLRDPRFRELFPDGLPLEIPEERVPEEGRPDGGGEGDDPLFENGLGSGVIIDAGGVVLTNNHVVEGADEVIVRLDDGREFKAAEVRTDPMSDLAVLKLEGATGLSVAKLGDSGSLEIGDWVLAIGSPFELEATVSAGIISGKGRSIAQIRRGRLLQTDAAINPGNSGGALVNLEGEVVGINTAIATNSRGFQGVGFAIPSNRARWVVRELLEHGEVRRAYLGIRIGEIDAAVARRLGVPVRSGVLVGEVIAESPAADAGIEANDIIVEFDGLKVRSPQDLQDAVEQKPLGTRQTVRILRDGRITSVQVTVRPLPVRRVEQ